MCFLSFDLACRLYCCVPPHETLAYVNGKSWGGSHGHRTFDDRCGADNFRINNLCMVKFYDHNCGEHHENYCLYRFEYSNLLRQILCNFNYLKNLLKETFKENENLYCNKI